MNNTSTTNITPEFEKVLIEAAKRGELFETDGDSKTRRKIQKEKRKKLKYQK